MSIHAYLAYVDVTVSDRCKPLRPVSPPPYFAPTAVEHEQLVDLSFAEEVVRQYEQDSDTKLRHAQATVAMFSNKPADEPQRRATGQLLVFLDEAQPASFQPAPPPVVRSEASPVEDYAAGAAPAPSFCLAATPSPVGAPPAAAPVAAPVSTPAAAPEDDWIRRQRLQWSAMAPAHPTPSPAPAPAPAPAPPAARPAGTSAPDFGPSIAFARATNNELLRQGCSMGYAEHHVALAVEQGLSDVSAVAEFVAQLTHLCGLGFGDELTVAEALGEFRGGGVEEAIIFLNAYHTLCRRFPDTPRSRIKQALIIHANNAVQAETYLEAFAVIAELGYSYSEHAIAEALLMHANDVGTALASLGSDARLSGS